MNPNDQDRVFQHALKDLPVIVPALEMPIQPCPGFLKKDLSSFKLDLLPRCEFGCVYCSSEHGNYLRMNKKEFLALAKEQLGFEVTMDTPGLRFVFDDVIPNLRRQLNEKPWFFGRGETLILSMLTDPFSPKLERSGKTLEALELLLSGTSFRIRVLTKSVKVASDAWIAFFQRHPGRFVVGLSTGTCDDEWAARIELRTSKPTARQRALRKLQDAGVPTFGMLCPVFPDVLVDDGLDRLIDSIRPDRCEHVWIEPYNDRNNWKDVRAGYEPSSFGYQWFTDVYGKKRKDQWTKYAVDLYLKVYQRAVAEGWLDKLRYLLYEDGITSADASRMGRLAGVLVQSKPDVDGLSKNHNIRALQVDPEVA